MSTSKPKPPDPLRDRLKSAGLRCTTARLAVLEHLIECRGPKTHAEVADALAERGFDRATIYRNLIELTEATILARVDLGDHVWRFELRARDQAGRHEENHPHFVCTNCGEVSCLDDVTVEITPKTQPLLSSTLPRPSGTPRRADAHTPPAAAERKSVAEIPRVTEVLLKGRCGNCVEP